MGKCYCFSLPLLLPLSFTLCTTVTITITIVSHLPGDTLIFNETWEHHPLEPWEFWFGDAIYRVCDQVFAKFQRSDGEYLTDFEVYMNNEVNDARQRVEAINSEVKAHAM